MVAASVLMSGWDAEQWTTERGGAEVFLLHDNGFVMTESLRIDGRRACVGRGPLRPTHGKVAYSIGPRLESQRT